MSHSINTENLIDKLEEKFKKIDQKTDTHLEGLLWAKPITYWDYINTDALLNLQIQRTTLPDEMVFIMYHQVNELLFKMILWEIDQISENENITTKFFAERLMRVSRYFDMLTTSFDIMGDGMEVEQYMKFRNTLTPASGFQSAQYRVIEFASTDLINLIDYRYRSTIDRNTPYSHALDHLYWQAAGKDHQTGHKSYLLNAFEGNENVASGDDVFLMQKINKKYPNSIVFLKNKDAVAYTDSPASFSEFVNQRIRWTSKSSRHADKGVVFTLFLNYLFYNVNAILPSHKN